MTVRSRGYKFTSKRQSQKGIMSTVMSVLSLIVFITALLISFGAKGAITERMGSAGFIGTLFALTGFVLGIISLNEEDVFRLFPRLGFTLSLISCILWGMIVSIGVGI